MNKTKTTNMALGVKASKPKWLVPAFALPISFLFAVRVFSVILERPFNWQDVVISLLGIAAVVMTNYVIALIRQGLGKESAYSNS